MSLILITKHCTFNKTFLYKYSIIAWIKVIIWSSWKGRFSLYKSDLLSLRFSTQTFKLDFWFTFFSDWSEEACVCVTERASEWASVCVCVHARMYFFFSELTQHIYCLETYLSSERALCIFFFSSFWWFC